MKIWKKLISGVFFIVCLLVPTSQVLAVGATLSLSPATGLFNQGCSFSTAINLDTGGSQTDGTDVILNYDPARFSVNSVTPGTIYSDYPTNDFGTAGTIRISGLSSVGSTFSGSGVFATVNFKVLPNAPTDSATQVTFQFDPNNKSKTTDSNVAQHGTVAEILNQVVNGSYNIGTNACGVTVTPANFGTGGTRASGSGTINQTFFQPTPIPAGTLSNTGSISQTLTLAVVGGSFLILGILGLAIL